jgi:hypothetical protein
MLKVFKEPGIACHEFERTLAVWKAGVSKQRPYEIVEVDGKESIVYDYLPGDLLMDRIARDKAHILRHIALMAKCQAQIGKGACEALPDARDGLAWSISHAPHLEESRRAMLLKGLAAMPGGDRILHGDLHPLNIIINGNEPNAIDWMTCSRGDAAADIARSYFILRYSVLREDRHIFDTIGRRMLFGILGGHYMRRVLKASGADRRSVMRWLPFVAAARLTEDRPKTEVKEIQRIVRRYCGGRLLLSPAGDSKIPPLC